MGYDQANFDKVAWDKNDEISKEPQVFRRISIVPKLEPFVSGKFGEDCNLGSTREYRGV